MFPTYYAVKYVLKVKGKTIRSIKTSMRYNRLEEVEDRLKDIGFIEKHEKYWIRKTKDDKKSYVEAHIYTTTSKYNDYMIVKKK